MGLRGLRGARARRVERARARTRGRAERGRASSSMPQDALRACAARSRTRAEWPLRRHVAAATAPTKAVGHTLATVAAAPTKVDRQPQASVDPTARASLAKIAAIAAPAAAAAATRTAAPARSEARQDPAPPPPPSRPAVEEDYDMDSIQFMI